MIETGKQSGFERLPEERAQAIFDFPREQAAVLLAPPEAHGKGTRRRTGQSPTIRPTVGQTRASPTASKLIKPSLLARVKKNRETE